MIRLLKKKEDDSSIRKVVSDEVVIGYVGLVSDFIDKGFMKILYPDGKENFEWIFISCKGRAFDRRGTSRKDALREAYVEDFERFLKGGKD